MVLQKIIFYGERLTGGGSSFRAFDTGQEVVSESSRCYKVAHYYGNHIFLLAVLPLCFFK